MENAAVDRPHTCPAGHRRMAGSLSGPLNPRFFRPPLRRKNYVACVIIPPSPSISRSSISAAGGPASRQFISTEESGTGDIRCSTDLQKRGKEYVALMHRKFTDYEISHCFIDSSKFGLAQTRQRFLLVGRRRDVAGAFSFPMRTVGKPTPIREALSGLPEPPLAYSVDRAFANHQRARVSDINIKRFSFVPQGGGWRDIPEKYRLPCHQRVNTDQGGWPDVFGRLEWNGLCPTITGGFDSFTRGRYGHPLENRPLTPREAARIQGFPDEHVFMGNRGDVRSQIGNAVPPPVAYGVGSHMMKSLLTADGLLEEDQPHALLCDDTPPYRFELKTPSKPARIGLTL